MRYVLPFQRDGLLCASTNDMPATRKPAADEPATTMRTDCLTPIGWQSAAPDISSSVPRIQSDSVASSGSNVYVATFRSVLPTGRYRFGFSFRVLRLRDATWEQTQLGDENPNWLEQGRVFEFRGQPWALIFSQKPATGGGLRLRAKLVVRRITGGVAVDVGAPLLSDHAIYGPIHWDLTSASGKVYALYPVPNARTRTNEIHVAVLKE